MNAGVMAEKHAPGAMASNLVLISALGPDLGWPGHGHYKIDFEAQSGESASPPTDKVPDNGFPGMGRIVL